LQSRYSELNAGFTLAVNAATALGVALLFVLALFLTRKRRTTASSAPEGLATQTAAASSEKT